MMMESTNGNHAPELIETTDEEGKTHYFEPIDELEVEGKTYALLLYQGAGEEGPPAEDAEGYEEELVLMRVGEDADGTPTYEYIEDEAEYNRVLEEIEQLDLDIEMADDIVLDEPGSQN
jgi:uncharacterized protein YrzB (UPF0473 family)